MMAPIFYEIGVIFGKGVIKISIRTEVEYGGKKYNSIKELCTEIGVSYSSVSHKFYRTHDIEEAVAYARSVEERKKSLVLWGKQYESLSSMANTFGVNIGSLRAKINDKDTLEEMLTIVKNEQGRIEAPEGGHDDQMMGLAIAHEIREQVVFSAEPIEMAPADSFGFEKKHETQYDYGETITIV